VGKRRTLTTFLSLCHFGGALFGGLQGTSSHKEITMILQ